MIEEVKENDALLAIILRAEYEKDGIAFFTPDDLSQQLAYMKHPPGKVIPAHVHNPVPRQVHFTQEALFIRKGKVRIDFYDDLQTYLSSRVLKTGDVVLLVTGGHGFEMLEETEMVEVKQGPYAGEEDKTRFQGISSDKAVIHGRA